MHRVTLRVTLLMLGLVALLLIVPAVAAQATAVATAAPGTAAVAAVPAATAAATPAASTSPLTPLGINSGYLLAQIINFLVIAILLGAVVWRPLVNMMDSRSAKIQKGLEDAAAAANARRNAETEAEKIFAQARTEAARTVEEARGRGEDVAKQVEAEARAEADRIRADATQRATEERDRQLSDLRGQVASIAIAVAQRLIGELLDQQRQQALINDFFARVPADAKSMTGDVEVISAMPLTDEEKTQVQGEIGASNITYSVDPSILGGLVIRSGERVVDGSVRSGLTELSGKLR